MKVYSVMIYDPFTGHTSFEGPWLEEWAAEMFARQNNLDCKRTVIKWQMLNAEYLNEFDIAQS